MSVANNLPYDSHLEMLRISTVFHILFVLSTISCEVNRDSRGKKKSNYVDKSLWKKEYEEELTDAILSSRKQENVTRVPLSAISDNESVVEKLMETITSSEKCLKKVDSIDFRLNRLDIEVHEKTNSILKKLSELSNVIHEGQGDKLETILDTLKTDVDHIKLIIDKNPRKLGAVEEPVVKAETSSMEGRLTSVENLIKDVMSGVDSIVTTMAEVKSRQHARTSVGKPETGLPSMDSLSVITEFRRLLQDQRQKKCECRSGRVDRAERYPTDCHEIQMQGFNVSGIYKIKPDDIEPFYILCDLITAGGGWTVFQNRFDGSQDFYKGWSDYKHGFGNLAGEFWLGLEKLNYLTNQKLYELRVEVETQHGQEAYAGYSVFTVGPEYEGFRISTLGTYYGTAGDSLSYHAGQKFSTPDSDNDEWRDGSCSVEHGGAWWYKECDKSNLNGKYASTVEENRGQSIYWISFKGPNYPLTKTKMMIRPLPASKPFDFGNAKRGLIDVPRVRPVFETTKNLRSKDAKSSLDQRHHNSPYRFDDRHADGFYPY